MITLRQLCEFCSTDETRQDLIAPFVIDQYTIATDGRTMVAATGNFYYTKPAGEELAMKVKREYLAKFPTDPTVKWEQRDWLRPLETEQCSDCDGDGCDECDLTGRTFLSKTLNIGCRQLNYEYLIRIQRLLGVMFAVEFGGEMDPLPFKFDGGIGFLMPMRKS